MDKRLENEQATILSRISGTGVQHVGGDIVVDEDRTRQYDLDLPVMDGRQRGDGFHPLGSGNSVANGPNVFLHNNEHNRDNNLDVDTNPWIFLTGGSGYIGSHLAANIKSMTPNRLMIIDRRANLLPHTTKYCDLFADEDFASFLILQSIRDFNPSCVIHLAASSTIGPGMVNPLDYWDNNVTKTLRLIKGCIDHNVKNFIFASTSSVYEDSINGVTEDSTCNPPNAYARTKHAIEMALQDCWHSHGLRSISFRFFNAAGAHPFYDLGELNGSSHLVAKVMEAAVHNSPFAIFGRDFETPDKTAIRDYTHVMDIVDAVTTAVPWLNINPGAHVINLGAGRGHSVQQVVDTAEQILNKQLLYKYVNRRDGDTAQRFADIPKAERLLGWKPKRNLNDIIRDSYKWYNCKEYNQLTRKNIRVDL